MTTVKNLSNSPYDLPTVGGSLRLPAFGEATGDFEPEYLEVLKSSHAVAVLEDVPQAQDFDRDALKKRATSLGIQFPRNVSDEKLKELISAKLASETNP